MRLKSAPLDLILHANGLPTGDELRAQEREAKFAERRAELAATPYLNSNQRRNLRRVIEKANQPEQDRNQ